MAAALAAGFSSAPAGAADSCKNDSLKQTFTLWQLPPKTNVMMNSYVLRTKNGKIIVMDGGNSGDAPYLREFLKAQGNKVEAWFISHAHNDHFDALKEILLHPTDLQIKTIYGDLNSEEWVDKYENYCLDDLKKFDAALHGANRTIEPLKLGELLQIDGVNIEVLGVSNPEIHPNAINNSSVVLRVSDSWKSVLFLGDLGPEGGEKLLHSKYRHRVQADYVQMAHHGQNGVAESFYQAVQPKYCLWPTTWWIWDNDGGKGKNTANLKTFETRAWIEKLHVKANYIAKDGLYRID